jgi:hypothetical protein
MHAFRRKAIFCNPVGSVIASRICKPIVKHRLARRRRRRAEKVARRRVDVQTGLESVRSTSARSVIPSYRPFGVFFQRGIRSHKSQSVQLPAAVWTVERRLAPSGASSTTVVAHEFSAGYSRKSARNHLPWVNVAWAATYLSRAERTARRRAGISQQLQLLQLLQRRRAQPLYAHASVAAFSGCLETG